MSLSIDLIARFLGSHDLLFLDYPAAGGALAPRAFRGRERISGLFRFELDLERRREAPDPGSAPLLGRPIAFGVRHGEGRGLRIFQGHVRRIVRTSERTYRAEVVPWLWFLRLATDCRVFGEMAVPTIVKTLLDEQGFAGHYELRLARTWADDRERDYTVQYRESALAFLMRLCRRAGWFSFFEPGDEGAKLVIADDGAVCPPAPGLDEAVDLDHGWPVLIKSWRREQRVVPGGFALKDYDSANPSNSLLVRCQGRIPSAITPSPEAFDYPGGYATFERGREIVELRRESAEVRQEMIRGEGIVRQFTAGCRFVLGSYSRPAENGEYLLTEVVHRAWEGDGRERGPGYTNRFVCVPCAEGVAPSFRPQPPRRRPRIHGPQTAVVLPREGSDSPVDHQGRVRVRFHWQHPAKAGGPGLAGTEPDGGAAVPPSCWIRIAQRLAGPSWGESGWPSAGQEVVVEFLDGDPERPLITGCVYNGLNPPPHNPALHPARWGLKGKTQEGRFNELRLDDLPDQSRRVVVNAGNDLEIHVHDDAREAIGQESHRSVARDDLEAIGNDRHLTIAQNEYQKVGGDRHLQVGGQHALQIAKDHSRDVTGNVIERTGKNHTAEAAGKYLLRGDTVVIEAASGLTITTPGTLTLQAAQILVDTGGSSTAGGAAPIAPKLPLTPETPPLDAPRSPGATES